MVSILLLNSSIHTIFYCVHIFLYILPHLLILTSGSSCGWSPLIACPLEYESSNPSAPRTSDLEQYDVEFSVTLMG